MDLVSKTFKDDLGRPWTIDITAGTMLRVKSLTGFSFDSLIPPLDAKEKGNELAPIESFIDDTEQFFGVLVAILKPAIEKAGITDEQFLDGFRGEGTTCCVASFLEALGDFFRNPAKRTILRGMAAKWKAMRRAETTARARQDKILAEMTDEKIDAMVNAEIDRSIAEQSSKTVSASPV